MKLKNEHESCSIPPSAPGDNSVINCGFFILNFATFSKKLYTNIIWNVGMRITVWLVGTKTVWYSAFLSSCVTLWQTTKYEKKYCKFYHVQPAYQTFNMLGSSGKRLNTIFPYM